MSGVYAQTVFGDIQIEDIPRVCGEAFHSKYMKIVVVFIIVGVVLWVWYRGGRAHSSETAVVQVPREDDVPTPKYSASVEAYTVIFTFPHKVPLQYAIFRTVFNQMIVIPADFPHSVMIRDVGAGESYRITLPQTVVIEEIILVQNVDLMTRAVSSVDVIILNEVGDPTWHSVERFQRMSENRILISKVPEPLDHYTYEILPTYPDNQHTIDTNERTLFQMLSRQPDSQDCQGDCKDY